MKLKPEVMIISPPQDRKMDVLSEMKSQMFAVMDASNYLIQLMPNGKDVVVLLDPGQREQWDKIRDKVEYAFLMTRKNLVLDFGKCPGFWKD